MKDPLSETLERALRVDPSPEFLARVRQRAATAPANRWWGGWKVGLASAAVAAVLATVGWIAATRMDPKQTTREGLTPILASSEVAPSGVERLVAAHDARLMHRQPAREERASSGVLVPRDELAAFRQWISRAQSGSFGFTIMPDAVPVDQELSVSEITVMPIDLSDSLE